MTYREFSILLSIILLFILTSIIIEYMSPYRYDEINLDKRLLPPSLEHILGTDPLGRDLFIRLLHGLRVSLTASLLSIAISASLGSFTGMVSTLISKALQIPLESIFDFLYIVPSIFIAAVVAFATGFGVHVIVIAIAFRLFPVFYRITRTIALTVSVQPYIESIKAIGASTLYILINYIAREAMPTIAVLSIYSIPEALSMEISLSFIGLGIQPPTPSIGNIIADGIRYIAVAPHIVIAPTIAIFIIVSITDILGERIKKMKEEQMLL